MYDITSVKRIKQLLALFLLWLTVRPNGQNQDNYK